MSSALSSDHIHHFNSRAWLKLNPIWTVGNAHFYN